MMSPRIPGAEVRVCAASQRVYRTGPFSPSFNLTGDKPDAAAWSAKLKELPANTWTANVNPPHLPKLNRDWGSAVLDTDHDLILRWSGGHWLTWRQRCAALSSRNQSLGTAAYPVEFPLGQLYSHTTYPDGWNFNLRPWVTGHTYQNYGYDPVAKLMLFTGPRTPYLLLRPRPRPIGPAESPAKPERDELRQLLLHADRKVRHTPQGLVTLVR